MGKTKTKFIDDSQVVEEPKKAGKPKDESFGRTQDKLVEKLKAELRIDQNDSEKLSRPEDQKSGESEKKQPKKVDKSKPRSKKYQEVSKDLDRYKTYPLDEAIELTRKMSYSKFTGTLEAHINTAQTGIKGLVSLPYFTGKKLRILAFGADTSEVSKLTSDVMVGGVTFGDDSTIEQISKGKIDFDLIVTTPDWMPKLARVAKNLGPRGLMPNPKNGTIASPSADGFKKTIESFQTGKTEYKTESKTPVIHLGLGKLSQPSDELSANVKTLLTQIGKTKIKKVSLSPTMGPSVRVDLISF